MVNQRVNNCTKCMNIENLINHRLQKLGKDLAPKNLHRYDPKCRELIKRKLQGRLSELSYLQKRLKLSHRGYSEIGCALKELTGLAGIFLEEAKKNAEQVRTEQERSGRKWNQ